MTFSNMSLVFATVVYSTFSFAQTQDLLLKQQISDLSREIRQEAVTSVASNESLQQARLLLEDALDLVKSHGAASSECIDFAYEKYFASTSSQKATEKAVAACKIIKDLDVAKYSYEKYFAATSSSNAMDKATTASGVGQKGKLDIISFAYDKYFSSTSSTAAMNLASSGVIGVPRGQLNCVINLDNKYFSSTSSKVAMDKALAGCSE